MALNLRKYILQSPKNEESHFFFFYLIIYRKVDAVQKLSL